MSQNQSAPNAQSPIVLNPQTLAKAMQWLERAQNHAGNLALKFSGHESALELTEIECEIATAYDLLSHVIMSGVKKPIPPIQAKPKPQAPTVLLDDDGQYTVVDPTCTPPAGYQQVCTKCGYNRFMVGVTYSNCPQCQLSVVYHCRYVAIVGGV